MDQRHMMSWIWVYDTHHMCMPFHQFSVHLAELDVELLKLQAALPCKGSPEDSTAQHQGLHAIGDEKAVVAGEAWHSR